MGSCWLAPALYVVGGRLRRTPRVKSHSVMRQTLMSYLAALLIALLTGVASASSSIAYEEVLPLPDSRASSDGFLVVRGRLRECMRWDGRVLEIHDLSKTTRVSLLGLRELDVDGLTNVEINRRLEQLLDETFPFEETPLVIVELPILYGVAFVFADDLLESQAALREHACPKDPPKAPYWWPRGPDFRKQQPWSPPWPLLAPPPSDDPLFEQIATRRRYCETPSAA